MAALYRHKYLILLLTLVAILVVQSLPGPPRLLSAVLAPVSILAVLLVVFRGRGERIVASAGAVAAIAVNWAEFLPLPDEYRVPQAVLHGALRVVVPGLAVGVILRNIFAEKAIAGDEVLGTVCGYLLAAGAWTHLYVLTEVLAPGAFSMAPALTKPLSGPDREAVFYYFSLVTLTTMGYGDITPVRPPATVLATLEAVFGQFYIAVVVAQLVGLRLAQAFEPRRPPPR